MMYVGRPLRPDAVSGGKADGGETMVQVWNYDTKQLEREAAIIEK